MSTSGMVIINNVVSETDAMNLTQMGDTVILTETHNNVLRFNESTIDPIYSDGYINKSFPVETLEDVNTDSNPDHNNLFCFNNSISDPSIADGWTQKTISVLLESFQVTIEGLVAIKQSLRRGKNGNPGTSDCVIFSEVPENGNTASICSPENNNVVYKREPTDTDFIFMGVLQRGQINDLQYPKGTILRSSKGLVGFSGPFPLPLGLSSLSADYFRFYAFRQTVFVIATSAGLECVVTLYASDETTIVDGPYTIASYASVTLECNANAEFVLKSTSNVYCGSFAQRVEGSNPFYIDQRLLPPMSNEIISWNRFNRVTAQESNTLVRWYRRNGETGIFTINAGTPVSIYTGTINEEVGPDNAGNDTDYGLEGCVILRANKPISCFSGADTNGWEATPGWVLDQLSQVFANPSNLNNTTDAGSASVTIGGPYEGTASVYDSTGTFIDTFQITRGTSPATTSDEQLYPASGQWLPVDSGLTNWLGGWVEVNVPCFCVMNFNGISGTWTSDAGDEMVIPGITPERLRANIITDSNGLLRRRDIDGSGVETWNVC